MCAINGITWVDTDAVTRMNAATKHRGPDGTAVQVFGNVTFGHNRLAIIDPDPRSNQPMTDASGRYTIIYNGELYNFKDIKKDLSGYAFKTESDTEVILAGFAQWGTKIFNKMNGVYALAIHDAESGAVTLARDPMGVNPLYVTKTAKGHAFSSEIKGLLELGVPRTVRADAFATYMRTLYVPGPDTMFEGIQKFPQGKWGVIQNGAIEYGDISYEAKSAPLDWRDSVGLKNAVEGAVVRQLLSDRPLGIYLSGGVDSSAVLASAMTTRKSMDTFSVGFALTEGEEQEKFNADSVIARRTAKHFGATHHEFTVRPDEVFGLLSDAAHYLDEPVGNATGAAQLALSKLARETAVVALTGDGGDELFGGYPRYRLSRWMDFHQRWTPFDLAGLLPFDRIKKLETRSLADRFALFHFQKDDEISDLLAGQSGGHFIPKGDSLMEMDRHSWLVDEALMRTNKLSMASALEPRPPLLDLELVAAAAELPFDTQVSLWDTKILLKRAFKGTLPEWILNQPKRGWFSPGAKWLRHPALAADIDHALSPGFAPATDSLFNWDGIKKALNDHRTKKRYRAPALIAVLMFQLWSKRFEVAA